jgi:hypothetical protein
MCCCNAHYICYGSLCPMFTMWIEYPKSVLLFEIASACFLCLVWNVAPMYFIGQSMNYIWWMQLLLYLYVCECCFIFICFVFHILNVIFTLMSQNC